MSWMDDAEEVKASNEPSQPSWMNEAEEVKPEEKDFGGFVSNLGTNLSDLGGAAVNAVKHPIDTAKAVATSVIPPVMRDLPGQAASVASNALVNMQRPGSAPGFMESAAKAVLPPIIHDEGQRLGVGELASGNVKGALNKLGDAAYERPIDTALDFLPAAGALGKTGAATKALSKGLDTVAQPMSNILESGAQKLVAPATRLPTDVASAAANEGLAKSVLNDTDVISQNPIKNTSRGMYERADKGLHTEGEKLGKVRKEADDIANNPETIPMQVPSRTELRSLLEKELGEKYGHATEANNKAAARAYRDMLNTVVDKTNPILADRMSFSKDIRSLESNFAGKTKYGTDEALKPVADMYKKARQVVRKYENDKLKGMMEWTKSPEKFKEFSKANENYKALKEVKESLGDTKTRNDSSIMDTLYKKGLPPLAATASATLHNVSKAISVPELTAKYGKLMDSVSKLPPQAGFQLLRSKAEKDADLARLLEGAE